MRVGDLCALIEERDFPAAGEREHPERDAVLAVREAVTTAVRDDEFLVDCMALELKALQRPIPRRGLVPFYVLPSLGVRFAFGYWPPGKAAGAHEHTAWTITAVCRNRLSVQTFDREQSYRNGRLVAKNLFDAEAGRVGFIYERSIHDPRNPTNRWSLSLHVTSPRDGEVDQQDDCPAGLLTSRLASDPDDPLTWVELERQRHILVHQIARFAAGTRVAATEDLLRRCGSLGAAATRRFVDGLGRTGCAPTGGRTRLRIVNDAMTLSCRAFHGRVALGVEARDGWVELLSTARLAHEALSFCASHAEFAVADIPGSLTADERTSIAEALEQCGAFRWEPS